ncbi:uncharacterized protein B0H18DRAFT_1085236 [Fomitopsis serialis]|uniref:uncharacterized protein n=1 Tax=Fomitopsis serialis TaxID=139415 RepID=UPI002007F3D7|nr:uncharacterized protein B0H18DRAFT_1085236 [Neoantrodia serialis]KAH9925535.1 hypothetical protein B0H18DRAFT_1085236 [Neoantrodia serialis]
MPGTHLLPPNLLKLFAPRPPLPYTRPLDRDIDRVRPKHVEGVGGEEPAFTYAEQTKREVRREERKKKREEEYQAAKETVDKPADDPEAVGDPYKTLFIARLHKNATDSDLRREFEGYGSIERVRIVRDKKGRSRGFAFIVFERERDMKAAYKESDRLQIMGKRVLVDVERGRTVRGWKPRRLGGGLGGRPKPEAPAAAPFIGGGDGGRGGGSRGGRGGGFRGGFGGGGFRDRDDFGGGRGGFGGGGGHRGRGGGIGFQGSGGFGGGDHGSNGYGGPPNGPGGFGGPGGGFGGPPDGGPGGYGPPGGGFGGGGGGGGFGRGGYRGDLKREGGPGGYDDRDAKRPRY